MTTIDLESVVSEFSDESLDKGDCYNESSLGTWFDEQTRNRSHIACYRQAIKEAVEALGREPESWLDCMCGNGAFMQEVANMYPSCHVMGLDGSQEYVDKIEATGLTAEQVFFPATEKMAGLGTYDIVSWMLPDLRHPLDFEADREHVLMHNRIRRLDTRPRHHQYPSSSPQSLQVLRRVYADMVNALAPDGIVVTSGYAYCRFGQLSPGWREMTKWTLGFGKVPIRVRRQTGAKRFSTLVSESYHPSGVIEDSLTANPDDLEYYGSVEEAVEYGGGYGLYCVGRMN